MLDSANNTCYITYRTKEEREAKGSRVPKTTLGSAQSAKINNMMSIERRYDLC